MKKIFLVTLIAIASINGFSQAGVCGQFHREYCNLGEGEEETEREVKGAPWQYNAQSKSGLFNQGMTSKMRCVIYKGMDYKISVCCETTLGDKVSYKIFDVKTNELLFDNSTAEDTQVFEFQSTVTRQLVIEVSVPSGETEKSKTKPASAACVGLLIQNKITDRQGFSHY